MSEPFANETLSAYLDGELSDAERVAFESQLAGDPGLQSELDELSGVRAFLTENGAVSAPAGFLDDILAAVEDEPQVVQLAWYRRPFGVPIEGIAVAAAALLVVYIALPGGGNVASAPVKDGQGAAAEQADYRTKSSLDSLKSSYGNDAVTQAEPTDDVKVTEKTLGGLDQGEGTVDAVANMWEPATQADQDGVADIATEAKEAGVDNKLRIPGKFDLSDEESLRNKAESLMKKEAQAQAQAEAERKFAEDEARLSRDGTPPAGEGTSFARVPYSYNLFTEDPEVLFRLAAIAAKYRGEVTRADKRALEVEELDSADAATVLVQIPAHALQDFGREIRGLGSVSSAADNTIFAGDPVEVRVRVQLAAGAPEGTATDKNATRVRQELDSVEEAH